MGVEEWGWMGVNGSGGMGMDGGKWGLGVEFIYKIPILK